MTVCRYYLQGNCRFGQNCKFEHTGGPNTGYAYSAQRQLFGGGGGGRGGRGGGGGGRYQQNQNQNQYKWQASDYNQKSNYNTNQQTSPNDLIDSLKAEMTEWDNNKMWPFSCVGFEKDCPCLPEFIDHSPEELRSAAYEAQTSGNIEAYKQQERALSEEYRLKRQQLQNITMTLKQKLISIIDDYRLKKKRTTAQGSNNTLFSTGGAFQSQSGASSSFGGQGQFGASSSQGAFGGSSSTSSAFGASNNQSVFGGSSSTSSAFGGSNSTQNAFGGSNSTPSAFGGSNSTPSAFGTSSITPSAFGGSSSTQSAFGSQQTFGASAFGTTSPTASSPFGANQNHTTSAFGVQQPGFPPATQNPSGFGNLSQPQSTGLFGKPANTTGQTQATGLFGKPTASPAANLFGGFSSDGASPSSFGGSASSAAGFTSGATGGGASGGSDKRYTPMDQLSAEELEAFQANKFTLGKIPTKPPPKELV